MVGEQFTAGFTRLDRAETFLITDRRQMDLEDMTCIQQSGEAVSRSMQIGLALIQREQNKTILLVQTPQATGASADPKPGLRARNSSRHRDFRFLFYRKELLSSR
jgi:hypothetical protein